MPGNQRGSLDDIKNILVSAAEECKDANIYYQVAIHVITSLGKVIEKAVENGNYDVIISEETEIND